MGYAKLKLKRVPFGPFDKGYFPNKDLADVPDGGSNNCKHVLWDRSRLRNMFGMDRINSTQVGNINGNGLFYFDVDGYGRRTAVFGDKLYYDVSGVWTDVTGTATITDTHLVQAINHQQGANKYAIYCNGEDPPWKYTGAAAAAVLGGSPPTFESIVKYHDHIFGSVKEIDYFSGVGDPETWTTATRRVRFDKTIVTQIDNGTKLAVCMGDHIGSVQGYGYLDFIVEETEIKDIGCVGRLAATNAIWQEKLKVFLTMSNQGLYMVDGSFGYQQIFGENWIEEFNQETLKNTVVAFSPSDNLAYVAIPYGPALQNDYLIVVDMLSGAVWPMPSIHTNNIRSMASMKDDSGNECIYFIDSNGYSFKFNRDTKNYHTGTATQAIDSFWQSGKKDFGDVHSYRRSEMLADADGDHNITVSVKFGLASGIGNSGNVNLSDEGDLLGSSFVLGASTLGGSEFVLNLVSALGSTFGRYVTIAFSNNAIDEAFNILTYEMLVKRRRMGANAK